ncbi:MAG: adenylate/guanylate cyclase domain-containing protein [Candidatus Limnocylindria bacterium]
MAGIQRKSFRMPDETETFPHGISREVHFGELVVARTFQEPGWRWSTDVKPIVGTSSCRFHHTGVVLRGRIRWRLDDGTEMEFEPDDVFDIPPGHDAWVVGDEPFETIDWVGAHRWASPPTGERVLATILFTDIVGSTARAEQVGDEAWGRLLEEHNTLFRRILDRFGGREVATTGDGLLAIFDSAERAVRGAWAISLELGGRDIPIRAGVHTGEIEIVPGNIRGVAVHVAARIMALARPGEVLVSGTTRGLIESRDLTFADRGTQALKGVSGARAIFALEQEERDPA